MKKKQVFQIWKDDFGHTYNLCFIKPLCATSENGVIVKLTIDEAKDLSKSIRFMMEENE